MVRVVLICLQTTVANNSYRIIGAAMPPAAVNLDRYRPHALKGASQDDYSPARQKFVELLPHVPLVSLLAARLAVR